MFRYYFMLGLRSLRRNPLLTALMVLTLAVGLTAASWALFIWGLELPYPLFVGL